MQTFSTAAKRIANFDHDLQDGLALGAVMFSHVPRLHFLANTLNLAPVTDAEMRANAAIVVRMFEELKLHWDLLVGASSLLQPLYYFAICQQGPAQQQKLH